MPAFIFDLFFSDLRVEKPDACMNTGSVLDIVPSAGGKAEDCYPGVCGLHVPVISSACVNRNGCDPECSGGGYEDIELVRRGAGISVSRLEGPIEDIPCTNELVNASACAIMANKVGTMEVSHVYSVLDKTTCKKVSLIPYFSA